MAKNMNTMHITKTPFSILIACEIVNIDRICKYFLVQSNTLIYCNKTVSSWEQSWLFIIDKFKNIISSSLLFIRVCKYNYGIIGSSKCCVDAL